MAINENSEVVVPASAEVSTYVLSAKKSKVRRNVILAGSAVGLVGIGSTLAANISLNGGNNVEFGQGVARTTSCDADGFTITPVASYDTTHSIWRLDRVDITGLNLTPVGTGHGSANLSLSDAKAQHPGEYYENGTWKRTCDGVVLDFKAYTDDTKYWSSTRDGYSGISTNDISSPVGWSQLNGNPNQVRYVSGAVGQHIENFGFSVVFDTSDDNSSFDSNYGVGTDINTWGAATWRTNWQNLDHSNAANSSFSFGALNSTYYTDNVEYRPDAGSISKIAVSSMATFSSSYYVANGSGIGVGS